MYSSNGPPSLSPATTNYSSYYRMAANINGQPRSYSYFGYGQQNSLYQFQAGPVSGGLDHAGWYNSGGQAPSVGAVSQSFVNQLSGSGQTYRTYAQAPSVGAVGQTVVSQASSNYQIYNYAQPPSVGAVGQTFLSQISGSHQIYSSHGQAPSVGAVLQTVVSQASSNYQVSSYLQPPSVGAVRQSFFSQVSSGGQGYSTYGQAPSVGAVCQPVVSQASDYDKIYNNVQPPPIEPVRKTFVSQPSGSNKIYSDGQPPTRNSSGRRARKFHKDVSEKSNNGKNSGTHEGASSIGMWLGLDAYGQAYDETNLFSFPNLEDYNSVARLYRHRRPKGE